MSRDVDVDVDREGMRCHVVESAGGGGSWIVPSWTVAARAYASDLTA